jgi:hypothetical protein
VIRRDSRWLLATHSPQLLRKQMNWPPRSVAIESPPPA